MLGSAKAILARGYGASCPERSRRSIHRLTCCIFFSRWTAALPSGAEWSSSLWPRRPGPLGSPI